MKKMEKIAKLISAFNAKELTDTKLKKIIKKRKKAEARDSYDIPADNYFSIFVHNFSFIKGFFIISVDDNFNKNKHKFYFYTFDIDKINKIKENGGLYYE